eukprot:4850077-Amphidinium_carterae.1
MGNDELIKTQLVDKVEIARLAAREAVRASLERAAQAAAKVAETCAYAHSIPRLTGSRPRGKSAKP